MIMFHSFPNNSPEQPRTAPNSPEQPRKEKNATQTRSEL